jgi:hypothetical protein
MSRGLARRCRAIGVRVTPSLINRSFIGNVLSDKTREQQISQFYYPADELSPEALYSG